MLKALILFSLSMPTNPPTIRPNPLDDLLKTLYDLRQWFFGQRKMELKAINSKGYMLRSCIGGLVESSEIVRCKEESA